MQLLHTMHLQDPVTRQEKGMVVGGEVRSPDKSSPDDEERVGYTGLHLLLHYFTPTNRA
jgi:hypothetical protein